MSLEPHQRWLAVSFALVIFMTGAMLWGLGGAPLTPAETRLVALEAMGWESLDGRYFAATPGPLFAVYTVSWLGLVGDGLLAIRLAILPFNLLLLLLAIKWGHLLLGPRGGTLAMVLLALSPMLLHATRHLGPETFTMVLTMLVLQNGWMLAEDPEPRNRIRWLVPLLICIPMLIHTDILGLLVAAVPVTWLVAVARRDGNRVLLRWAAMLASGAALCAVPMMLLTAGHWQAIPATSMVTVPGRLLMGPGLDGSRPALFIPAVATAAALLGRGCWILWKVGSMGAPLAHYTLLAAAVVAGLGWPLLAVVGGHGEPAARLALMLPILLMVCTAGLMSVSRIWRIAAAFAGGVPLLVSWLTTLGAV